MQNLIKLKKYWYLIIIIALIFALGSFSISKLQTPQYQSSVQLLIIQKYGVQFDAFTAKRSAETLSEVLSKVIYTGSFMRQVLAVPIEIKDTFSKDPEERKKEWKKTIKSRILESGNLEISVYQADKKQAEQLAYGIAYVLVIKGSEYHGGAKQVDIKMIEKPITSPKPVRPNILLNTILGFLVGTLSSVGILFLLPEKKVKKNTEQKISSPKKDKTIKLKNKVKKILQEKKKGKKRTGEEYSQEKVNQWVKSGKFGPR